MSEIELTPDLFTADYLGTPGKRTFFIQIAGPDDVVSLLIEKDQVSLLADKLKELLLLVDARDPIGNAVPQRDPGLALVQPPEARWRVGTMGLAYDDETDRVILLAQPAESEPEEEEPAALDEEEEAGVRLVLRRDQVRGFILHALAVIGEGRPICQLCGLPIDPEGHNCPASNGHRLTEV